MFGIHYYAKNYCLLMKSDTSMQRLLFACMDDIKLDIDLKI